MQRRMTFDRLAGSGSSPSPKKLAVTPLAMSISVTEEQRAGRGVSGYKDGLLQVDNLDQDA
ncbi:hypothetical protein E5D57_008576 [Metarhizium anisopliae]|nr:hypothetical protein E5D57_008576 [Metarhizium anisopliae]